MDNNSTTIFAEFNARFTNAEDVGSRFILSPFLEEIVSPAHSAVLGPRGSGKTTLLKMLTLPALLNWDHPLRATISENLEYLSVYVPASLTWSSEYRSFSTKPIDPEIEELLSISLFRHGFLVSLLDTWKEASHSAVTHNSALSRYYLPIDAKREATLVKHLARLWELEIPISTFGGIKEAITSRIRTLQRLSFAASRQSTNINAILERYDFIGAHFFDDADVFLTFLQEEYGFDRRLALCFDEVEIAPDSVAAAIIRAPRSINPKFLIKYSAAPYIGVVETITEPTVPTQRNDFRLIFLTSFSARDTRPFSEALFKASCEHHGVHDDPVTVLGRSLVEQDTGSSQAPSDSRRRYRSAGNYHRKFQSLYEKDISFREYIQHKNINISDLTSGSENRRAADIRKIIWSVLVREEFLFSQERQNASAGQRRRLRTASAIADIYTGAGSLFALCEGNPRWIKGLMDPMAVAYRDSELNNRTGAVRRSLQKKLVDQMISAFFALLSTVPVSNNPQGITSLVDLVRRVGEYFASTVLAPRFNPDPILSFYIDDGISPSVRALIGKGINLGAFVTTPRAGTDEGYQPGHIDGLRVRLSNIFAPHYRLPLAGGRTISLSTVLFRSPGADLSRDTLLDLFGEKI